jgi:hypothetical protein
MGCERGCAAGDATMLQTLSCKTNTTPHPFECYQNHPPPRYATFPGLSSKYGQHTSTSNISATMSNYPYIDNSVLSPTSHLILVPNRLQTELANPKSPYNRPPNTMDGFNPDSHLLDRIEYVQRIGTEVNIPDRFELFLLGDGEKKITEAIDTREFIRSLSCSRGRALIEWNRHPKLIHLYYLEGGPYSGQPSARPSPQGPSCHLCWLQRYFPPHVCHYAR